LYEVKEKQEQRADIEAGKMKIEWGSQIRITLCNLQISERCSNRHETSNVDGVMDGQIDDFLKAYLMMMGQKERITTAFFYKVKFQTRQDFILSGFVFAIYADLRR
jgi:hypothetical protein